MVIHSEKITHICLKSSIVCPIKHCRFQLCAGLDPLLLTHLLLSCLLLLSPSSKRKDSEPRIKCLLNNAEITPHHPKDPVEMRRINFQTPGNQLHATLPSFPRRLHASDTTSCPGEVLFAKTHACVIVHPVRYRWYNSVSR